MIHFLFLIGFVLLIKGADFLVTGAVSIANRFKISELVIGLTIVSFGTSMPELIVNILSSITGNSEIAVGNIFGSNIANILLILGVSAMINPLPIKKSIFFTEIPISLVAIFMIGFLANADLFVNVKGLTLSRIDGSILIFFFSLFMLYIFVVSKTKEEETEESDNTSSNLSIYKSIFYIIGGVASLFVGGKWVVDGAVELASVFELSETFVGLTIVAIGTSLPELVTSIIAAKKGKADIAVGNAIGSNIFNILWILGISAIIRPLPFHVESNTDILMMVLSTTLLIFVIVVGKKPKISRVSGLIFVIVYIAYMLYLVHRG